MSFMKRSFRSDYYYEIREKGLMIASHCWGLEIPPLKNTDLATKISIMYLQSIREENIYYLTLQGTCLKPLTCSKEGSLWNKSEFLNPKIPLFLFIFTVQCVEHGALPVQCQFCGHDSAETVGRSWKQLDIYIETIWKTVWISPSCILSHARDALNAEIFWTFNNSLI